MQQLLGSPHGAAWLQVPASLLHMIPMNLLVGGALLALLASLRSGPDEDRVIAWLLRVLPGAGVWSLALGGLSHAILLGVTTGSPSGLSSPYEGAWPVADLVLLTAAAIAALLLARRFTRDAPAASADPTSVPEEHASSPMASRAAIAAAALLLLAATILCAAAQNADERATLGEDSPFAQAPALPLLSGNPMPFPLSLSSASSMIPRLTHMILGAVAVAGMLIALRGLRLRRRDPRHGEWLARRGALWFSTPTGVQIAIGFWLLIALPGPIRSRFFGGEPGATALIVAGILIAIVVLILMTHAGSALNPAPLAVAGAATLLLLLTVMTMIREQARHGYLAALGASPPGDLPTTKLIMLILAVVIGSAAFTAWLWKRLGEAL